MTAPVSVAVVCMAGAASLSRCLAALREQRGAPPYTVTVVYSPAVASLDDARRAFPEVRFVANRGQQAPLALASRALRECEGRLVLLTKDYCVPSRDWIRTMVEASCEGRAAIGGRVEVAPDATATDWAYYFIDFHRYTARREPGGAESLTVCNVAYNRSQLEAIRALWEHAFVEAAINEALRERFGALWFEPASEVVLYRQLTLRAAVRERYAFGRLYGSSRLSGCSSGRRLVYILGGPALPFLLMSRMARAAARSRRHAVAFLRSSLPLTLIVVGRSWGEWLGYVTGRPPRSLVQAA